MGYNAAPLEKLIEEFSKFPGIGRKGATRMAYQVLSMSDQDAAALAGAIQNAHTKLHRCRVCQNYTEAELCPICASAKRDRSVICVVETPRDVQAFERTREYHGMYHVLHGLISPMDGIGAEQLTVKELLARLGDGEVKEVIMAMNPTVEGEATAMYLAKLIKPLGIKTTRLAYGLPVGASLEYTDETTLYRALSGRGELSEQRTPRLSDCNIWRMGRFCVQKKLDAFANLYGGEISGKILFITLFRKNRNFAR